MNKRSKITLIIIGGFIAAWVIVRQTNVLNYYSVATPANYPSLKEGDYFVSSRLIKPKRFDHIAFYAETEMFERSIWIFRLCGIEGDKIEIKDGVLYVNDKNADKDLNLAHFYILSEEELAKIEDEDMLEYQAILGNNLIITNVADELIQKNKIKATRQIAAKDQLNELIKEVHSENWNIDHFGPVIVPQGKYFLLGDNRHNAHDSRFLGFIDKKDCVATVWFKF